VAEPELGSVTQEEVLRKAIFTGKSQMWSAEGEKLRISVREIEVLGLS
jgi:hypothetical protein